MLKVTEGARVDGFDPSLVSSRLPLALLGCLVPFAAGGTAAVAASLPGEE